MPTLRIYHTNDMHGREGLLDLLRSRSREAGTLLLDAGDAIRGSNTAFRLSEPILVGMSRLGYAAMAMGNREFHYLRAVQRRRKAQRSFPILAANLVDLRGGEPLWQSSVECVVGGVRVGLLGATPVQYPPGAVWEKLSGFRFLDPQQVLPPLAEELAARNDVVILLSHLGARTDRALAPRLPGVSLIVGGHSHTLFTVPERCGSLWIVQAGSHGQYLGQVDLEPGSPPRVEYRLLPSKDATGPAGSAS